MLQVFKKYWVKVLLYPLATALAILVIGIFYALTKATLVLSETGVYQAIELPTNEHGKVLKGNLAMAGSGEQPHFPANFYDAPIVTYDNKGGMQVDWFAMNKAHHKNYEQIQDTFSIQVGATTIPFSSYPLAPPITYVEKYPQKVVVLSDIHGDIAYLTTVLTQLHVINEQGDWIFGTNHVVFAGDMVDKGNDVFALLWKIYHLSHQATKAQGAVHLLVGNHEQYVLRGNFSRVYPQHLFTTQQMMSFREAWSSNTLFGRWLRTCPVVLQIQDILFTHGGLSPNLLKTNLTRDSLNQAMWNYWKNIPQEKYLLDAVLGVNGVTQYRGLVAEFPKSPKATKEEIQALAKKYATKHIVVGHTEVEAITPLYDSLVIAMSALEHKPEVLTFENGHYKVVPVGIIKQEKQVARKQRPFEFTNLADWKMLYTLLRNMLTVMQISHPY